MAKTTLLSRDAILGASDIQSEIVDVPEWGGQVRVQGMSGTDRDAFEASLIKGKGKNTSVNYNNLRAKLLVRSIVDDAGERIFGEHDIAALGAKSSAALNRVYNVAQRLNGLSDEDVEELTEGLKDDPSADSISG